MIPGVGRFGQAMYRVHGDVAPPQALCKLSMALQECYSKSCEKGIGRDRMLSGETMQSMLLMDLFEHTYLSEGAILHLSFG